MKKFGCKKAIAFALLCCIEFSALAQETYFPDEDFFYTDNDILSEKMKKAYNESSVNLMGGFMSSANLAQSDRTVGYYFSGGLPVDFAPLGLEFSLEKNFGSLDAMNREIRFGPGFITDWNLFHKKYEAYEVTAQEAALNSFIFFQTPLTDSLILGLRAGGGITGLLNMKTAYSNGLENRDGFWIFPDAYAGMNLRYYFTPNFGGGFSMDLTYPFFVERESPLAPLFVMMKFSLGVAGRF